MRGFIITILIIFIFFRASPQQVAGKSNSVGYSLTSIGQSTLFNYTTGGEKITNILM